MMRRYIFFLLVAFALAGCNIYTEPVFDSRDRITGRYQVDEYSRTHHEYAYYSIYVVKGGGRDVVYIDDLYMPGLRVKAYYHRQQLDIPFQIVNGYEISGRGSVYGGSISFTYDVYDRVYGGFTDVCEAEAYFD